MSVPDLSLGVLRWIVGLYLLLASAPRYTWIADVPAGLFNPPPLSPAYLFGGFPSGPMFGLLEALMLVALTTMTIGWLTRTSTFALALCMMLGNSFTYSFGKIDHGFLVTALLVCMGIAGWGRHLSVDSARTGGSGDGMSTSLQTQRGLSLYGTLLAFGFLTAGVPKALKWIDGDASTSGILSWYYPKRLSLGHDQLLSGHLPGIPLILLELADYGAVLFELVGFLALLAGRRWWLTFLLTASAFHLANTLVLNISFAAQALTYLTFVNLAIFATKLRSRHVRAGAVTVVVVAFGWHVVERITGGQSGSPVASLLSGLSGAQRPTLYISIVVCIVVASLITLEFVGRRNRSSSTTEDDLAAALEREDLSARRPPSR